MSSVVAEEAIFFLPNDGISDASSKRVSNIPRDQYEKRKKNKIMINSLIANKKKKVSILTKCA